MSKLLAGPLSPFIIAASLVIFAGFSRLDIRRDFSRLAADTFYIYLFHVGVLGVLQRVEKYLLGPGDSRVIIPLNIAVTFVLSLALSRLWNGPLKELARRRAERKADASNVCPVAQKMEDCQ